MGCLSILCAFFLPLLIARGESLEIIGGNEAKPHSRPYMALIKSKELCGGTLIDPKWILTAAHCPIDNNTEVILGAHNWRKRESEQQKLKAFRGFPHPGFRRITRANDIQLVQLKKGAKLNKFVKVFPLPNSTEDVKKGTLCSTAGWGMTNPKIKTPSDVLQEVGLTIVDTAVCKKIYQKHKIKITKDMLCAGALKNGNEDTCNGDSGGPLICDKKLRGIVSFGNKICGTQGTPGVYTRLAGADYLNWIQRTIRGA